MARKGSRNFFTTLRSSKEKPSIDITEALLSEGPSPAETQALVLYDNSGKCTWIYNEIQTTVFNIYLVGNSPNGINRRRSLSELFHTVRARYSRDNLANGDDGFVPCHPLSSRRSSRIERESVTTLNAQVGPPSPPPRLDVLSELPADAGGLERTSSFTTSFEMAADRINDKYAAPFPPRKSSGSKLASRSEGLPAAWKNPGHTLPPRPPHQRSYALPQFRNIRPMPRTMQGSYGMPGRYIPERTTSTSPTNAVSKPSAPAPVSAPAPYIVRPLVPPPVSVPTSSPPQVSPPVPAAPPAVAGDARNSETANENSDGDDDSSSLRSCPSSPNSKKEPLPGGDSCYTQEEQAEEGKREDGAVEDENSNDEAAEGEFPSGDLAEETSTAEADGMGEDTNDPSVGAIDDQIQDPFDDELVEGEGDSMENLPEEHMSYMAPGAISDSSFAEQHGLHHSRQDGDKIAPDYAVAAFEGIIMTPSSGYRSSSAPSVADLVNKFRRLQYVPGAPPAHCDEPSRQQLKTGIRMSSNSEDEGGLHSSDEEFSFSEVMGSFCMPTGRKSSVGGMPQPYDAF